MNMLNRDLGTGELCDNIGLVGVSAKWSSVTASPSHHDQAIPILSPLLFMHVGHPYIPLFKIRRIFDLLIGMASTAPIHSQNPHFRGNRHTSRILHSTDHSIPKIITVNIVVNNVKQQ